MREPTGKIIAFAIALLVIVSGCATVATRPAVDRELAVTERTLVVGLYPYVPRLDQFQGAITAEWSKVRPDLSLRFLSVDDWDGGYSDDPPPQADVYVFDAMFFEYFRSQGWLEPMSADEIDDLDDMRSTESRSMGSTTRFPNWAARISSSIREATRRSPTPPP